MSTAQPHDTIPVSWYRIASSDSLDPIHWNRHIVYRLGHLLSLRREEDGRVVVTSERGQRRWIARERWGQVFVWHGPGDAVGEFPDWLPMDEYPVRTQWSQYIGASLCEIAENSCDSAHFPVVHHQSINANEKMKAHVDEKGRLVVRSTMNAYGIGLDHSIENILFYPGNALTHVSFLGTDYMIYGMSTPIDEGHTENCFILASRRYLGLGRLFNRLFFVTVAKEVGRDIPIWERKAWRERPVLCDGDGPIPAFRRWFRSYFPHAWAQRHAAAVAPAAPRSVGALALEAARAAGLDAAPRAAGAV